ncbi:MAG TPA: nitrilase-related carbon-nitrogen hydrolase [Gammaproteobacteria bacterium]|nr:nitrilase-related carbon-nitrogen hydrolase [Gammaproteobacteria bacterium]
MASVLDVRRLGLGLGAVLLMAAMVWFGTGLHPFWPLMWFAPLPVLLFANRARWWSAALVAGFGLMLGYLNQWVLFAGLLHAPAPVLAQIYLSEGIMFALAVLLYRALLRRGAYWNALLSVPAVVVTFEYLLNVTSPHGTAGSLAYSQLSFLPFLQLATVTGPWGMSFLVLAFSAGLAITLHLYPTAPKQALRIGGAVAAVLVLVLVLGTLRLYTPVHGPQVKVGLVASDGVDGENDQVLEPGAPAEKLFAQYAAPIQTLAAQGAQVVVLPEKIAVVLPETQAKTDVFFQSLVDRTGAGIVVGVIRAADGKGYNEARVYQAGKPPQSYDKQHMLPPFESNLTPGDSLTVLPRLDATWGVAICKDMDFTPLSSDYGNKGVGLMLVPGWDFVLDWVQHGHIALLRGVESGFSIVRSAKQGSLYVSDDRGRVLAEVKSDSAPFATLLTTVPAVHDETFYDTMGDWFAYLSLVLLAGTLLRLGMLWKRPAAA